MASGGSSRLYRLPKTKKELLNEWRRIKEIGDEECLTKLDLSFQALKLGRRSLHQTFILLLGPEDCGKTSTIDHLFGTDLSRTEMRQKRPSETTEWCLYKDDYVSGIGNVSLRIVQAPGIDDSLFFNQDARSVWATEQFFGSHPNETADVRPNLILFILSTQQMTGFMLSKSFSILRMSDLLDVKHPNLVMVLTHRMGCSTDKDDSKVLAEKIKILQESANLHLGLVPEVVVLDNRWNDSHSQNIHKGKTSALLLDGMLQPVNLYKAIVESLKRIEDRLALTAVNAFFRAQQTVSLEFHRGYTVRANREKELSPEENLIQEILSKYASSYIETFETVIRTSQEVLEKDSDDEDSNSGCEEDAPEDGNPEAGADDGEETVEESDDVMVHKLLEGEATGLERDTLPDLDCRVGGGYDLFKNAFTETKVFAMTKTKTKNKGFNFMIPANVSLGLCNQVHVTLESNRSYEEYLNRRLKELDINLSERKRLEIPVTSGHNLMEFAEMRKRFHRSRFAVEKRAFKLNMIGTIRLSNEFRQAVEHLPDSFEENSRRLKEFFDTWGHYIVCGVYYGGTIEGDFQAIDEMYSEESHKESKQALEYSLYCLSQKRAGLGSVGELIPLSRAVRGRLRRARLRWNGGDSDLYAPVFEGVSPHSWQTWENSVRNKPLPLTTNLDLIPISRAVAAANWVKGQMVSAAMEETIGKPLPFWIRITPPQISALHPPERTSSCYPPAALVFTPRSPYVTKIADLKVGEDVLSINSNGKLEFTKFYMWLHRDPTTIFSYLEIQCEGRQSLRISRDHIVFLGRSMRPIRAGHLKPGDKIGFVDLRTLTTSFKRILRVLEITRKGAVAVATFNGRLVVDGFAVSCYARVPNVALCNLRIPSHTIAHVSLSIMKLAYRLKLARFLANDGIDQETGIHRYALLLMKLLPFLEYFSAD